MANAGEERAYAAKGLPLPEAPDAMPVVMTGSPGGSIGGNSGGSFGSGLAGLSSSPTKLITPALETWMRRSEEDQAMLKERKKEYESLRNARLSMVSSQAERKAQKKLKEKEAFAKRQQELQSVEAAEAERLHQYRKEALKQPTLGSPEPPWAHLQEKCGDHVGSRPESWAWPTPKKHPELKMVSLGAEHEEAMLALPPNIDAETLKSYTEGIANNSRTLTQAAVEVRKARDNEIAEYEDKEKREREEAAITMRVEVRKKADAAAKAEAARKRQIKREMAEETAKVAKEKAQAEKVRYEKGLAERVEMVKHLKMDFKLRDEDEIANERREGSSMSKGGKADFVSAAKTKGNDDMVDF